LVVDGSNAPIAGSIWLTVIAFLLSVTGWLGWVVALGSTLASNSAFSRKRLRADGFPAGMMIPSRNRI
jgi:hypothetical protein